MFPTRFTLRDSWGHDGGSQFTEEDTEVEGVNNVFSFTQPVNGREGLASKSVMVYGSIVY